MESAVRSLEEQHLLYLSLLDLRPGECILDAGCGRGATLAIAQRAHADGRWVGLDNTHLFVHGAREVCSFPLVVGDLRSLPFPVASFDAVFSRDTLECLPAPSAGLVEMSRVLRPGGRLLVSHWDWDTQVFNVPDQELDRRMIHAFADTKQGWMECLDPRMGRKLRGLVSRETSLEVVDAGVTVLVETEWADQRFGYGQSRAMARFLPDRGRVTEDDAERWLDQLAEAARSGSYLYSANHYWCLARRRG